MRQDRRTWMSLVSAGLATPLLAQKKPAAKFPVSGVENAACKPLDDYFTKAIQQHGLPGLAFALTRNGSLVYSRGFGLANVEKAIPMQPNALFRIASVSKTITAIATLQLVEKRTIKLDTPILELVNLKPLLVGKAKFDSRWKKVTVQHCLHHSQGNDRAISFDPLDKTIDIAKESGTTPPLSPDHVARYMLGHPLDFDPGERYAYGNVGYLLLGRMIEKQAKKKYTDAVRESVFKPLGVTDVSLARAHPAYRPKGEVSYSDRNGNTGRSFYPPTEGQLIPVPDGAFNIEGFEGHAGWVCSAVHLVKLASAFDDPDICPLLKPETIRTMWARPEGGANLEPNGRPKAVYYGCGWSIREVGKQGKLNAWHYGILSGVSSLLVRRNDGFTWALLSNMDYLPDGKTEVCVSLAEGIHTVVDKITDWPTTNQFPKLMK